MATTTRRAADDPLGLVARTLPRWAPPAAALAAAAVMLALFAIGPMTGRALFVVLTAVLFMVVLTTASIAVEGRRHATDRLASTLVTACFVLAVVPLVSVLTQVVRKGIGVFSVSFLTHSMRNVGPQDSGGGVYHAIVGTIELAFITSAISIPVALLVAVYLVEYGRGRLARLVTFTVDVMTGVPSIVAGLFVYTVWILGLGLSRSGFPAALALTILMVPTVVRSTEEMLRLVPNDLREASLALGVPKWRTIIGIVLPTATAGIVTGVMLGIARVIGETAPLLLLIGGTDSINMDPLHGPQSALPLIIFDQASRPNPEAIARAWGAALTLILIVMLLNLVARLVARFARIR